MLEIRELRQLISLDEFRHFGRAARAVGLSQPALTKSLQRIEHKVGARLFERSRAGVIPTAVGKEVLTRARRLLHDADDLKRTVDLMTGAETGSVTIGVGPAMSETYVAAAVAAVSQHHRQTQIVVRVDNWHQLSDWLLAGELDFYVADIGEVRVDGRFHYQSLPSQRLIWFCNATHPLAKRNKTAVSRSDLLQFPIATPKLPDWATEWFTAALSDDGMTSLPSPFPAIECENYAMLKQFVLSGNCISAALQQTLVNEFENGFLVELRVNAPDLTTQAGIIHLADRTLSPLAQEVVISIENLASP